MTNTEKPKNVFLGNTFKILLLICFFILIGLFALNKYQNFFKETEVDITVIEDKTYQNNETADEIKSDIEQVFQIVDKDPNAESQPEYLNDDAKTILNLVNQIENLNERIDALETKIHQFNQISVKIPNYQQLVLIVIDLENALKKGQDFSSLILKIKNITQDQFIISRIESISGAGFLKVYGENNLLNELKKNIQKFHHKNVLKDSDTIFQKLFGDFVVIRKTDNFSNENDDLISQAEIFLIEGQVQGSIDNLSLLDAENFIYFAEYVKNAKNYLEALEFCDEIKSYLNL